MNSDQKSSNEIVIFLHQIMYGLLFAVNLIMIVVMSYAAYRLFDLAGLITAIVFFAVTVTIGGFFAYKRRHTSTLGRVIKHQLIK